MAQEKPAAPPAIPAPPKEFKLLGKNYVTPDLVAKVKAESGLAGHAACTTFELIELSEDRQPPAQR